MKQPFSKIIKVLTILLAILFVVSLSASSSIAFDGGMGYKDHWGHDHDHGDHHHWHPQWDDDDHWHHHHHDDCWRWDPYYEQWVWVC